MVPVYRDVMLVRLLQPYQVDFRSLVRLSQPCEWELSPTKGVTSQICRFPEFHLVRLTQPYQHHLSIHRHHLHPFSGLTVLE